MDSRKPARVHFIDWLRVLAVLLLFPFHTLRVFNAEDFYVKALPVSQWVGDVLWFISIWHMPLLFFLAGCSTWFALGKRSGGQYAWERAKRLLVPLVFGIFILIPPQTWYGGRFNSGYTGSYRHYLASGDFLAWNIRDGGDYYGGFGVGQLWFIMFLLIISLVVLPLLLWAGRGKGVPRTQAFCRRLAHPLWWILPIVVLFFAEMAPGIPGGPIVYYLVVFLFGVAAVSDARFAESAERYRLPAIIGGVGLSLACVLLGDLWASLPDPSAGRVGLNLMSEAATWLMLVGAMGLGKRYLDRSSRTLSYLAEGSYPVYVLHQTVIVVIAFYLVRWTAPHPALWVVLLITAVAGTFALYEIVRRVNVLRFLFGMHPRRRAVRPTETAGAEAPS